MSEEKLPPIWLLDVDGVINAISRRPDPSVWPKHEWITGAARAEDQEWPMLIARPVVDFINRVHVESLAEIRWHTTWQHHADRVAAMAGLPIGLPVVDAPEYQAWDFGRARGWWKLPAVRRVAAEGRPIVWTDDDAAWRLPHRACTGLAAMVPLLVVAPNQRTGLTRKHLRQVDAFLTDQINANKDQDTAA